MSALHDQLARDGFALVPGVLDSARCAGIAARLAPSASASGGTRCLLEQDWCAALAGELRRHAELAQMIPADHSAVQCTYFEKSAARNWLVPLHQDLSIPVADRVDAPELRGWSSKEGRLFVQPPAALLGQLLAVRLHLDDCGPTDGALRLVPGSHLHGAMSAEMAQAKRAERGESMGVSALGGVLLMRPLLLHASSRSTGTSRRRVLHFVFGPTVLPFGLAWQRMA